MPSITTVFTVLVGTYAVATTIFIISENRRPQSTLAWMLGFYLAPVIGLAVYFFFGRDRKAFSKESKLVRQNLGTAAEPLIAPFLQSEDQETRAIQAHVPSHQRLMRLVRRNSNSTLVRAGEVSILQDAKTFYPKLVEDMKAASHSIHHQYYIWGADSFTEELKEIMIEKAQAGIKVRLLYDPIGSFQHLSWSYLPQLRSGGVHVAPTSPLYHLHTMNFRNHRKLTVIDGTIGYAGGMNIGGEHLDGGPGFDHWRDTQLRIPGDGAAILQSIFMTDWYNAVQENLFTPDYFPRAHDANSSGVPVQILTSGPDSQWAAIRQLYAYMIGSAQHRVFIQSPFFIPDATLTEALGLAALAGVDVRLMISAEGAGGRFSDWAARTYFQEVASTGVRVFLYEGGYLHAKTIAVDSEVCSIGSANIDIRSFSIHYELNAVVYDATLTRELEAQFEKDLPHCSEFDPEGYERQGQILRFRDSAARLLSPLL